jgi:hypothetical protein
MTRSHFLEPFERQSADETWAVSPWQPLLLLQSNATEWRLCFDDFDSFLEKLFCGRSINGANREETSLPRLPSATVIEGAKNGSQRSQTPA